PGMSRLSAWSYGGGRTDQPCSSRFCPLDARHLMSLTRSIPSPWLNFPSEASEAPLCSHPFLGALLRHLGVTVQHATAYIRDRNPSGRTGPMLLNTPLTHPSSQRKRIKPHSVELGAAV